MPIISIMLFSLTITVFGMVIFTFVRWVDRIARLGRLGNTIDKVEKATAEALTPCQKASASHAAAFDLTRVTGHEVFPDSVGYVQRIGVAELHAWAEQAETWITVMIAVMVFCFLPIVQAQSNNDTVTAQDVKKVSSSSMSVNRLRCYLAQEIPDNTR